MKKKLVKWERMVEPDRRETEIYQRISSQHLALQNALFDLVDEGKLAAMWRATGI